MILNSLGEPVNVAFVEHIIKVKQRSGSNPWPVIEELFKVWERTHPKQYKSHLIYIKDVRATRRDKFASSDPRKDPVHNGILRYTLDIPDTVMYMIRKVYSANELSMNREFFLEFARKFPKYKVAEKL